MIAGLFLYACRELADALPAPRPRRKTRSGSTAHHAEMLGGRRGAGVGRRVVRARLRRRRRARSGRAPATRADLRREPGLVRARRRRPRQRSCAARARERPRAPLHRARRRPPPAGVQPLRPSSSARSRAIRRATRRTRASSATQHVDHARLVPARRGRPGARVLPDDLPVRAGGPDRDLPQRAVRLRADDRRARRGDPR